MIDERKIFGVPLRWARRALVVSLALNFLLIGVAVGVGVNADQKRWGGTSSFLTGKIVELTAEDRRPAVEEALSARREARAARRALRIERWDAIAAAIAAQPFDRDSLVGAMAAGRDAAAATRGREHESFAAAVSLMTDQERAELADAFKAYLEEGAATRR